MKRILMIAMLALAGAAPAYAADLVEPQPVPVVVPASSGWYLRGDIGYAFNNTTNGSWKFWNQFAPPYRGVDDNFHYDKFSMGGAAIFGGGVGYRFNEMLRADATLDFFRADVNGHTACPSYVKASHGLSPTEDNCNYRDSSSADVWLPMANLYVDLPHLGPITPYVGAGVGAAYVKYDNWKTREDCPVCTFTSEKDGRSSWRFAGALMAGASYDLTNQLKLDLGYRFVHIAGGDAYGYDAADRDTSTGPGATGTQAKDNGFNVQTVRLGLRYEF
ncbi:MAG: outer membrane protein [Rhizobiaceae bacterium]